MKKMTLRNILWVVGIFALLGTATLSAFLQDEKAKVTTAINEDDLIVEKVVMKMISYFGDDLKRTHHSLKVHNFARTIAKLEGLSDEDRLTLEIAAVLHDIGIPESQRKYDSMAGRYQEKEGPPIARELIRDLALDKKIADRVCYMIGFHHTYEKVDRTDFQILFEADFLVNMYEGRASRERIMSVQKKIFKTQSGKDILNSMLKRKNC